MLWLYFNNGKDDKSTAIEILFTLIFTALFLLALTATAQTDEYESETRLLMCVLCTVPLSWALVATTLGIVDANK